MWVTTNSLTATEKLTEAVELLLKLDADTLSVEGILHEITVVGLVVHLEADAAVACEKV